MVSGLETRIGALAEARRQGRLEGPEHWVLERSDLLKEIRFGERHPPDPIRSGDTSYTTLSDLDN